MFLYQNFENYKGLNLKINVESGKQLHVYE